MSLDRKILNRIEENKIGIIPRWFFVLKDFFSLSYAAVILMMSSFALAMAVFVVHISGWEAMNSSLLYIWSFIFAGLFAWGFKKMMLAGFSYTYKSSFAVLVPAALIVNIISGFVFYKSEQVSRVEAKLEKIPAYEKLLPFEKNMIENYNWKIEEEKSEPNVVNDVEKKEEDDKIQEEIQKNNAEIMQELNNEENILQTRDSKVDTSKDENTDTSAAIKSGKNQIPTLKPKSESASKNEKIEAVDDSGDGEVKGTETVKDTADDKEADVPEVDDPQEIE